MLTLEAVRGMNYQDDAATCSDQIDGMISANVEVSGSVVDLAKPSQYEIVYNCADSSGIAADPQTRTVVVVCPPGHSPELGGLCTACPAGKWTQGYRAWTECVDIPTPFPTPYPTPYPTDYPTAAPTAAPTSSPTIYPTPFPTPFPTPVHPCDYHLTDRSVVTLAVAGGGKLEWGNSTDSTGALSISGGTDDEWIMMKCISGDCTTGALGSPSQWTDVSSEVYEESGLKTCDVVALYNKEHEQVLDCFSDCQAEPYPVPAGHLGSVYKIHKTGIEDCSTPIKKGDSIFFSRMDQAGFHDSFVILCSGETCQGTTDGNKTTFIVDTDVQHTCDVLNGACDDVSSYSVSNDLAQDESNGVARTQHNHVCTCNPGYEFENNSTNKCIHS